MRRSGHIGWVVGMLLLATAGCQTTVDFTDDLISDTNLLSGEAILGEAITGAEHPDIDIVATNEDMREFVADLQAVPNKARRFWRLLQRMRDVGDVPSRYDAYANLTAREASSRDAATASRSRACSSHWPGKRASMRNTNWSTYPRTTTVSTAWSC